MEKHSFVLLELILLKGFHVFLIDFYIISEAIATVVTIAEILKNNGLAVEKSEILAIFSKSLFLSITY